MNKFVCPDCGNISYTADTSQIQKCPYCIEKHLIVNQDFMELVRAYNAGSLKLIVNRRRVDRRINSILVDADRRTSERRRSTVTPIGWMMVNHPSLAG